MEIESLVHPILPLEKLAAPSNIKALSGALVIGHLIVGILLTVRDPFTSSFTLGFVVPIPTFPLRSLIDIVRESSSSILSTIRFQELDVSPEPIQTLSASDNPAAIAQYQTERISTVRKKTNPEYINFLR